MSLLHKLMDQILEEKPELSPLKMVVEKELLHHDVLRIMRDHNLMEGLTFIGGTCLRACYGSTRLSEDLDFTGGANFSRQQLADLASILETELYQKYGLQVAVSQPIKDSGNVDTWKIKIETRKKNKHLPAQRINIDICSVPSYDVQSVPFLNLYDVDMGTSGFIVQAQSRQEIFVDKLLAFAFRPNRIKYRDLWDILWLAGHNVQPSFELIPKKLQDRNIALQDFFDAFAQRLHQLEHDTAIADNFVGEMSRFLSQEQLKVAMMQDQMLQAIVRLMQDLQERMNKVLIKKEAP